MKWMGAADMIMFATDYPHYDFDDPTWVSPRIPKEWREKIFYRNAQELYGLPASRPLDALDSFERQAIR
jgi:predicted TIM-barrel fold metal-dependent hydrolase